MHAWDGMRGRGHPGSRGRPPSDWVGAPSEVGRVADLAFPSVDDRVPCAELRAYGYVQDPSWDA